MHLSPKRRWPRFSVRTLLIAVTIFCVWLGWQMSIVREREAVRRLIESRALSWLVPGLGEGIQPPFARRLLGDRPGFVVTQFEKSSLAAEEEQRIRQIFPETTVSFRPSGKPK